MKNNKSIYIVGIFMLITMVSIGYALLSGKLNINGSAKVKASSWDIYFNNIKIKEGSVTASVAPSISDKTTVNFEVELSKPGDYYEFNVDVVNDGDLDAMIESISITPELTTDQQKYLSYSVTYFDDVPLEVKDILHAQKTRTIKVRVEYLKSVENVELNSNDENLNIHVVIKYIQADSTAKSPTSEEKEIDKEAPVIENVAANITKATKDTEVVVTFEANDENEIIDTLTKEDIIVKVGGTTVTPTTKVLTSSGINTVTYNLSMTGLTGSGELTLEIDGSKISDEYGNIGSTMIIKPGVTIKPPVNVVSGNGTQVGNELVIGDEHFYVISNDGNNVTMLAKYNLNATSTYNASTTYKQNTDTTISPVKFSSTNYWGPGGSLKSEYGKSYPAYVYNNNASVKTYVDNYKEYLESLGVSVIEARLIKKEELQALGCSSTCSSAPSWVYLTTYWSGSAISSNSMWGVTSNGNCSTYGPSHASSHGVRPVIVISTDSI